jgi:hypothetical protein
MFCLRFVTLILTDTFILNRCYRVNYKAKQLKDIIYSTLTPFLHVDNLLACTNMVEMQENGTKK